MEILGVPVLALIFICIAVCVGGYLLTKPQEYKDELSQFEDVISKWPSWLVRVLGIFLIVFAGSFFYMLSRSHK